MVGRDDSLIELARWKGSEGVDLFSEAIRPTRLRLTMNLVYRFDFPSSCGILDEQCVIVCRNWSSADEL